jgi:hypothetical protein
MGTRLTAIADRAEGVAATSTDRLDELQMFPRHRFAEALAVGGAELAEDVLDGAPLTDPPSGC